MAEKGMRSLCRRTQDEERGVSQNRGYEDTKAHVQMNAFPLQQNKNVTLQQINTEMLERINAYEKRLDEKQHQVVYA